MRQADARTWTTLSAWAFFSLPMPATLFKQLHGTLGGAVGVHSRGLCLKSTHCLGGGRENTWAPPFTLLGTALLVSSLDTEGTHKIVLGDGTFCLENGRKLPRVWGGVFHLSTL